MPTRTTSAICSLAATARASFSVIGLALIASTILAVDVQRWKPYDAAFTATEPANAFTQDFKATVTGPGGISFTSLGFFDGSGTWKIRVGPSAIGTWSVTTISSNPALNGRTASFNCIANTDPDVHGGLRVDPQKRHHFIREDGSPYYLLGYEANWLWAVDQTTFPLSAKVTNFLDQVLVANGFNHVLMNSYAYDTTWKAGKTEAEDWGPPALLPWLGSKGSEDFTRMNLPYWNHYDQLMEALRQRGITAHIYIRVHNKPNINIFPANNSTGDNLWWQWMVARYAAFPNVVFDGAKEWNYEPSVSYKQARLQYIRDNDPYDRLTTAHTDYSTYDNGSYNNVVDFRTDQKQDSDINLHQRVITQRQQRNWPIFNSEPNYEVAADGSRSYGNAAPADQVLRSSWAVTMAGGYMAYYYTWTAWDVLRTSERPIGYTYHRHMGEFFRHTNYQDLVPSDNLVSNGSYCLANPGNEYVVYRANNSPFTLTLTGLSGTLPAQWFNVRTGVQQNIGALGNGTANLTPPSGWNEVALRVGGPAWNQGAVNQPPTVQLTSPSPGVTLPAPATVTLTATATDSDGSVAKVEFYQGSTKVGEDLTSPYAFTVTSLVAGSYSFSARAIDNLGAMATSAAVTVTVSGLPPTIPTAPSNPQAAATSTTQITLTWTDNANNEANLLVERKTGAGGTYAQIASLVANASSYLDSGLSVSTTYVYRVRAANVAGTSAYSAETTATTLAVTAAPAITTQPGNQTVGAGQTATFTVVVTGTGPLSFQWKRGTTNVGTNSATLTLANAQAADAGSYTVTVTNSAGSVVSSSATLTVNAVAGGQTVASVTLINADTDLPIAGYDPLPNGAALNLAQLPTRNLNVRANTTPVTVGSVRFGYDGNTAFSTETNAPYALAGDTSGNYNAWTPTVGTHTVIATPYTGSAASGTAGTALTISFTVSDGSVASAPAITTQPVSLTVSTGQSASFTVVAGGSAPLTYAWRLGSTPVGGNSATLSIASAQVGDAGAYICTVSNSLGSVTSAAATLTVNAVAVAPAITSQPGNQTVAVGQTATFTVVATGTGPLSFQWKRGTTNVGSNSATLSLANAQTADAGSYAVTVTNSAGSVVSNAATLSVTAAIAGGAYINAGGPAVGAFVADSGFSGGTVFTTTNAISTTGVANVAPLAVYQSERYGASFSYAITGLTAGGGYTARLHFAETYWTAAGKRSFNVAINGGQVLSGFDLFATAGANAAVVRDFAIIASASGQITIAFSAVIDNAKISGIEIITGGATPPPPSTLPTSWVTQDVGTVTPAGSASFANEVFTLTGAGVDIWNTSDGMRAVSQTATGNCDFVGQVLSLQNTDPWAKAGVMLRATMDGASAHAMTVVTPGNGISFQNRVTAGASSNFIAGSRSTAPRFVRISRRGNVFSGYESADGITWTLIGQQTIIMPATINACLVVTSHRQGTPCTATITQIGLIPVAPN